MWLRLVCSVESPSSVTNFKVLNKLAEVALWALCHWVWWGPPSISGLRRQWQVDLVSSNTALSTCRGPGEWGGGGMQTQTLEVPTGGLNVWSRLDNDCSKRNSPTN